MLSRVLDRRSLVMVTSVLVFSLAPAHAADKKKAAAAAKSAAETTAESSAQAAEESAKKAEEAAKKAEEAAAATKSQTPEMPATPALTSGEATPEVKTELSSDRSEGYGKTYGLLGPVTVGPHVALGLPRPLNVGLEAKFLDIVGVGFNYGALPTLTISNVKVKFNAFDGRVRWFAFRGAFFVGAGVGQQTLAVNKTDTILTVPLTVSADVKTTYLTPHIGWRWQWASGITLGMELGYQHALSSKTTLATSPVLPGAVTATAEYQKISTDVNDAGKKFGDQGLPHFTLLQIGYMF